MINLLPETLNIKQKRKMVSRRTFAAGVIFLLLTLILSFGILSYGEIQRQEELKLAQELKREKTEVQSLKETEGVYRFLKVKAEFLSQALTQKKDPVEPYLKIREVATHNQINVTGFTYNQASIEILGNSQAYFNLSSFLEELVSSTSSLPMESLQLKNIYQNGEKGQIEFSLMVKITG